MKFFAKLAFVFTIILSSISACTHSPDKSQTEPTTIQRADPRSINQDRLQAFGKKYTASWCSQKPELVASLFAKDGSLKVNDAPPAVGREAITKVAQGFMTAFPDMVVSMDSLLPTDEGATFHWTLTGTNTGPNGTGKKVRVSGFELWQFNSEGLINQSLGYFDADEYNRQLKFGANH